MPVIMIVLQMGHVKLASIFMHSKLQCRKTNGPFADRAYISNLHLFLCIRSSNAEKLMVLRCYDHDLNTDRKRRL